LDGPEIQRPEPAPRGDVERHEIGAVVDLVETVAVEIRRTLNGLENVIFAERDRKLEEARAQRKARRTADRHGRLAELILAN